MRAKYTHRGITHKKNKYIVVISKRESDIHSLGVQWVGQGERYFYCQLDHDERGRTDARALESYVYRLRSELSNVAHVEYVSFRNTTFLPEEDALLKTEDEVTHDAVFEEQDDEDDAVVLDEEEMMMNRASYLKLQGHPGSEKGLLR